MPPGNIGAAVRVRAGVPPSRARVRSLWAWAGVVIRPPILDMKSFAIKVAGRPSHVPGTVPVTRQSQSRSRDCPSDPAVSVTFQGLSLGPGRLSHVPGTVPRTCATRALLVRAARRLD